MVAIAPAVVELFLADGTAQRTQAFIVEVLRWTSLVFVFDTLQVYLVHVLRAIRCTLPPLVVGAGACWGVGLAGGLVLAHVAAFGAPGLWAGFCAALVVTGLLLGRLVRERFARPAP